MAYCAPALPAVGEAGGYRWLTSEREATVLIRALPQIVIGKTVAVTAMDSGELRLEADDRRNGWMNQGGIAWHPQLPDLTALSLLRDGNNADGFYELYTLSSLVELEEVQKGEREVGNALRKPVWFLAREPRNEFYFGGILASVALDEARIIRGRR